MKWMILTVLNASLSHMILDVVVDVAFYVFFLTCNHLISNLFILSYLTHILLFMLISVTSACAFVYC